jgi:hypothetical protein
MLHPPVTGEAGASPIYVGLMCDGVAVTYGLARHQTQGRLQQLLS